MKLIDIIVIILFFIGLIVTWFFMECLLDPVAWVLYGLIILLSAMLLRKNYKKKKICK